MFKLSLSVKDSFIFFSEPNRKRAFRDRELLPYFGIGLTGFSEFSDLRFNLRCIANSCHTLIVQE